MPVENIFISLQKNFCEAVQMTNFTIDSGINFSLLTPLRVRRKVFVFVLTCITIIIELL
jgi:hypothetical protein